MPEPEQIVYKVIGDTELNLFAFRPSPQPEQAPAIVFFFCGGWRGFDHTKFYPQSTYLASRGMVCLNAQVRVRPVHDTSPETCITDAKSAIRYVRANAAALGIDPDRIAVGGGSAAGAVTACCGTGSGPEEADEDLSISSRPDAMVLFNPGTDYLTDRGVELFGSLEKARSISPLHHVAPGNPPAVVLHGDADKVVPVETARAFADAMTTAGNRCDLIVYEGAGHGFFNYREEDNPYFKETLRETDRFLASLGYLEGTDRVDQFSYPSIKPESSEA